MRLVVLAIIRMMYTGRSPGDLERRKWPRENRREHLRQCVNAAQVINSLKINHSINISPKEMKFGGREIGIDSTETGLEREEITKERTEMKPVKREIDFVG